MTFTPLSFRGGDLDELQVVREDSTYTAESGQHVVSKQGTISLPSNPSPDDIVMVSRQDKYSPVVDGNGNNIEGEVQSKLKSDGAVMFLSDGSQWYATDTTDVRFDDEVHISTKVARDDATIDFIEVFDREDQYDRYKVYIDNFVPDTDSTNLDLQLSSNGGSTFDSGASDYAHAGFFVNLSGGSGTTLSSSSDSLIQPILQDVDSNFASNDTSSAQFSISGPSENKSTLVSNQNVVYRNSASNPFFTTISGGIRLSTVQIDSIRLLPSSGSIRSGIFSVYGVTR